MFNVQKRIEEARANNAKGAVSWIIDLNHVEQAVKEFKAVHPAVTHKVTIDWDDDSLNRIRFAWEPGTFGVVKPLIPLKVPEKVRSAERW